MAKKVVVPSFEDILNSLRNAQFEIKDVPGVLGQKWVSKHGVAAILIASANAAADFGARPGFVVGNEISRLLDKGNQKFLKTSKIEIPATADRLRAVHLFSEELKLITGAISLYNESLGTVSNRYVYDRLKGRDLPLSQRSIRPWELPDEK